MSGKNKQNQESNEETQLKKKHRPSRKIKKWKLKWKINPPRRKLKIK